MAEGRRLSFKWQIDPICQNNKRLLNGTTRSLNEWRFNYTKSVDLFQVLSDISLKFRPFTGTITRKILIDL